MKVLQNDCILDFCLFSVGSNQALNNLIGISMHDRVGFVADIRKFIFASRMIRF